MINGFTIYEHNLSKLDRVMLKIEEKKKMYGRNRRINMPSYNEFWKEADRLTMVLESIRNRIELKISKEINKKSQ